MKNLEKLLLISIAASLIVNVAVKTKFTLKTSKVQQTISREIEFNAEIIFKRYQGH